MPRTFEIDRLFNLKRWTVRLVVVLAVASSVFLIVANRGHYMHALPSIYKEVFEENNEFTSHFGFTNRPTSKTREKAKEQIFATVNNFDPPLIQERSRYDSLEQAQHASEHNSTRAYNRTQKVHQGTKEVHQISKEVHQDTKEVHHGTQEVHQGTNEAHQVTKEVHQITKEVHKDTKEVHHGTQEVHQGTNEAHQGTKEVHQVTKEVQHVIFLKIHKAGSSTIQNIFLRFGLSRDLKVLVPQKGHTLSQSRGLNVNQFVPYSEDGKYDILCCHVVYGKSAMVPYFPQDTKYIGIVRQPFSQFVSSFWYYREKYSVAYLKKIPGINPIRTFLENHEQYERKHPASSWTNNLMSFDFGYPPEKFNNISAFRTYVDQLVKELDYVMVLEYFDESLVILKRMLGWTLKDILYVPVNTGPKNNFTFTDEDRFRHKQYAKLDYILYERFLGLFQKKLDVQEESFYEDLDYFKRTRESVSAFCVGANDGNLTVLKTSWNEEFEVTRQDCNYMTMEEVPFVNLVRRKYVS